MRVLHIAPSASAEYGGPTRSLAGYARAAMAQGCAVTIAAPAGAGDGAWLEASAPGASVHVFRAGGDGAFVWSTALLRWLSRVREFDIVHVHGLLNPISSLAARRSLNAGMAVVLRPFGTLSRYTFSYRRSWLKRQYFRLLDGPNLRAVHAVHFTTDAERDESAWHGIDWGGRAHVVPPAWLDGPVITPTTRSAATVLFLARLHPVKHVEALIDAWVIVRRVLPPAQLVIAGRGEPRYVARLKERARSAGRDAIRFVGGIDGEEKARLLASAAAFVLPSRHENFGVAVLEALGAGTPVVVTPEVHLSAFVREHGLGRVAARQPAELAQAIVEVIRSDALRAHCETRAPALVRAHFSPEAVGTALLQMYNSVLTRSPNR